MLINIKYVEIYVANLVQSKFYYEKGFGFKEIYTKSDKNNNIEQSLLKLGSIFLLLTSSKDNNSSINKEVNIRGDTIKDIGLEVNDIRGGPSWLYRNAADLRINSMFKIKLQTCYSLALKH